MTYRPETIKIISLDRALSRRWQMKWPDDWFFLCEYSLCHTNEHSFIGFVFAVARSFVLSLDLKHNEKMPLCLLNNITDNENQRWFNWTVLCTTEHNHYSICTALMNANWKIWKNYCHGTQSHIAKPTSFDFLEHFSVTENKMQRLHSIWYNQMQ